MLHPVYFFKDKQTGTSGAEDMQLIVQIGDLFFGFLLFHAQTKKADVWAFYQTQDSNDPGIKASELEQLIQEHSWMNGKDKKVTLINYASRNALVPTAFNTKQNLDAVYELMLGNLPDELRLHDAVASAPAVHVHAVPVPVFQLLQEYYPNAGWFHIQSLLLQQAAGEACITATVYFNQVFITVEKNRQWKLLQTWQYQTPEDVLYYLLSCLKQFNMNAETTEIRLEGMIDQQSALANVLNQYLANINWNRKLVYTYPDEANTFSSHTLAFPDRILACVS